MDVALLLDPRLDLLLVNKMLHLVFSTDRWTKSVFFKPCRVGHDYPTKPCEHVFNPKSNRRPGNHVSSQSQKESRDTMYQSEVKQNAGIHNPD